MIIKSLGVPVGIRDLLLSQSIECSPLCRQIVTDQVGEALKI